MKFDWRLATLSVPEPSVAAVPKKTGRGNLRALLINSPASAVWPAS